ncbi:MAG TPA: carbohydrate porin [Chthoniobacteraceae bacterium]|jgi:porin|nr:carbohydrate porin [Chthoniobacteraceae bacterium]
MKNRIGLSLLAAALLGLPAAQAAPYVFDSPYSPDQPGTSAQPDQPTPRGPLGAGRASDLPEGLMGVQDTLSRRDTLTGNWGGLRDTLGSKGISLTPIYQGEIFGNSGGADQGFIADGLFNFALDLDLERITGFWKDANIHANALYIYGNSLSGKYIGDFSNTSNIAGYNSVKLQELWLEQNFWNKRFSIRAGMLAADTEFFTSDSAGLFLNGTFGAFTLIGANFTNAPIYPVASPGIRFSLQPVSKFYLRAAVFGMDSSADPTGNNRHGTHFHINDSDGALFMGELGYLLNQSPNDRGLVGTYKIGGFAQRGNYPSFDSQAKDALGTGGLSGKGTNYAFYGVADQELYKSGGKVISAFVRGGFAPARLSFVDGYVDGGLNLTGFLPGRANDVAGVAVGYSHVSNDFSHADVLQGNPPSSYETVLEASYKIVLAPWWSVQPDLQYIFNPSGVKHSRDAFVLGVRTTVTF